MKTYAEALDKLAQVDKKTNQLNGTGGSNPKAAISQGVGSQIITNQSKSSLSEKVTALAELIEAWPRLPENIRSAILVIVRQCNQGAEL